MNDAFTLATATATAPDDFPRDRYGRPMIVPADGGKPLPYGRPSSFGKKLEDTYGLEQWQRRMVTVGLARTPSLVARAATIPGDPKAWTKAHKADLNAIADEALIAAKANQAADIGTSLHRMTELADLGDDISHLPEPFAADVAAYRAGMVAHGFTIDSAHVECRMVCDELRLAGTTDRIPYVPTIGKHRILDLKTGESIELAALGYAVQLAVYAHSVLYDVATGQRTPIDLDLSTALIVHLPAGKASFTLYEVDVAAGWEAALVCAEIDRWRKRKNLLVAVPIGKKATVETVNAADETRDNLIARCKAVAVADEARGHWLRDKLTDLGIVVRTCDPVQFDQIHALLLIAEEPPAPVNKPKPIDAAVATRYHALANQPGGLKLLDELMAEQSLPSPLSDQSVTDGQLEAIRRVLDEVGAILALPANAPHKQAPPIASAVPTLDATPDEGPLVGDDNDTFAEMRAAYGALDDAGKAWVSQIVTESIQAGRSLHMVGARTLRRVRTMLGLALLAGDGTEDDGAVRALVHLATGVDAVLFPSVPLGAAVSVMDANEAEVFVATVRLFLEGMLAASVDDDGHVRLGVAA
jgi:hypothetical protein